MSQVRKDILNGWKEIGRYVGRDTRTVERWEKQRGLPVRRVPGTGRATVYALTSELDEWLENSGQTEAAESVALDSTSPSESTATAPSTPTPTTYRDADPIAEAGPDRGEWLISGRLRQVAIVTVTVAAALLVVLALPVARSHANPAEPVPVSATSSARNSAVPYRSQVPGVDDLYLRGIYSSELRTSESLTRSEEYFSDAIAKDPEYAPAYAGLANTYNLLREYSAMPEAEAYAKAKAAAEHSIALDPNLPEAHTSLGFIEFFWLWDTATAEKEFRTALALDPTSALTHHWFGSMLTHEGRYAEAIEQLNIAQRLEPTSAAILSTRAFALGLSGHRVEAIGLLQDLVSESPGTTSPHSILMVLSKVEPRDTPRFLYEMRQVAELRHNDEMLQVVAAAEPAFHSGGEREMWSTILTTEQRLHPAATDRTYLMAEAETALGRYDAAFADLTLLAKRRDPPTMGVIVDPTLAPLRGDRRYGELVASMGLPAPRR